MSLDSQAALAQDMDFINRVAACAAKEPLPPGENSQSWAVNNIWEIASAPGFGEAYESALIALANASDPGKNPAVISDGQILSAVQAVLAQGAV